MHIEWRQCQARSCRCRYPGQIAEFLVRLVIGIDLGIEPGQPQCTGNGIGQRVLGALGLGEADKSVALAGGKTARLLAEIERDAGLPVLGTMPAYLTGRKRRQSLRRYSLAATLFLAVPLAIWFVDFSKRRGKSILEERHQRGAMLVDGAELAGVINAHNRAALEQEIAERMEHDRLAAR